MTKHFPKLKRLLSIILVIGFLIGLSIPAYAQTLSLQAKPSANMDVYELSINDEVIMRFRSLPQGLTAYERCRIILSRINMLSKQGSLNADDIKVQLVNGMPTLTVGGQVLATVTGADLQANNSTQWGLLESWQKNFKRALIKPQSPAPNNPVIQPVPSKPAPQPSQPAPSKPAPQPSQPAPAQPAPSKPDQSSILTADEQKMLNLVNQERARAGLPALKVHTELVKLARLKSQDMINNRYFSHQSPVYGSPFDMMRSAGISYTRAGENLAGASTVERAHTNLMNSPGHRANILNKDFTHIGIGIVDGGPYGKMFTQMFIRP
ncbi:CAP domain-containing protein [Desulfitibacter alkalitolerans]|uniref:CAP domain-containing protein n=1 Tax=Desulfitibacter alkalitolerans TaxID=264641 RepID=UPI00048A2A33|nr:CAP domain-containing protein [Desulfitibacter alkalitolerans]